MTQTCIKLYAISINAHILFVLSINEPFTSMTMYKRYNIHICEIYYQNRDLLEFIIDKFFFTTKKLFNNTSIRMLMLLY